MTMLDHNTAKIQQVTNTPPRRIFDKRYQAPQTTLICKQQTGTYPECYLRMSVNVDLSVSVNSRHVYLAQLRQ